MKIWLLLLIPIAVTVGMLMFYRKKVSWWEYLSLFGVSALIILISKLIITTSMTSDTEYWSEPAYKVVYDGAWDEWIVDECSYDCFCTEDKDGNETCSTCWEDCSYRASHNASWKIVSKSGRSFSISESEYKRIVGKWGNEKRTGNHSGRNKHYDHGIYESTCEDKNLAECIVSSHSYENKVQAANTEYKFDEVTEKEVAEFKLYEYPEIYENYKQSHILGSGDETFREAVQNMDALNAELGPDKQLKAFILIFKNQSEQAGIMQENYWKGGNKNEFVLTIGVDNNNNIQWAHPFTWSENVAVKSNIRSFVAKQGKLNLAKVSSYMYGELDKNFERKHFKDFNYLTVEPSNRSMTITTILLIIINVCFAVWFILNEHNNKFFSNRD